MWSSQSRNAILSQKSSASKISKPPPFKLRDLPKYSQRLKEKDLDPNKWSSLLGGKYFKLYTIPETPRKKEVDFATTPVYKQFVLEVTEVEALADTEEDLEIVKQAKEEAPEGVITDDQLRALIEQALNSIFKPSEIEYYISLAKKKSVD